MADLDDFFAKKDRKKSKSVKKFATADELAKKLEDTNKKPEVRPKKERPTSEGDEANRGGEEEEWKEYEEPVKDYTGLKIQVLQGGPAPESGRDATSEDSTPDNVKIKGPWNKPVEAEQAPVPPPAEEKPVPVTKVSTYVPPASRVRAEPIKRNQSKHAPDIHNDDYFPVLGASGKRAGAGAGVGVGGGGAGGGGGWSTAGARSAPPPSGARHTLALGNRFTTLQDDS